MVPVVQPSPPLSPALGALSVGDRQREVLLRDRFMPSQPQDLDAMNSPGWPGQRARGGGRGDNTGEGALGWGAGGS